MREPNHPIVGFIGVLGVVFGFAAMLGGQAIDFDGLAVLGGLLFVGGIFAIIFSYVLQ